RAGRGKSLHESRYLICFFPKKAGSKAASRRPVGSTEGGMRYRWDMAEIKDPKRAPLLLATDTALLRQAGVSRTVACKVFQVLSRSSSVYVEIDGSKKEDFLDDGRVDVYLRRSGVRFQGSTTGIDITYRFRVKDLSLQQKIIPSVEPLLGRGARALVEVGFALVNGPRFFLRRFGSNQAHVS